MGEVVPEDDELAAAAAAAGLQKLLGVDAAALRRALDAAQGYSARRAVVEDPFLEPAHCFRPAAPEGRE